VRASTLVMIGFAVVFGVLAVFVAQVWLNNQASKQARHLETAKPVATRTIVVAKKALRFGTALTANMMREVPWPAKAMPAGAFAKISDVLGHGKRVVLTAIEPNEPILALKITGPGQRATLSALVQKGMKAVTIRVNDVEGVGGFVQPGDHVDVVLTRQAKDGATSQVVLQDARVLAVDQHADDRSAKATVPKSVTLEVDTVNAQKLWLAASVGKLSLLLRKAGETADTRTHRITLKDLAGGLFGNDGSTTTVTVIRPKSQQKYTVPVENKAGLAAMAQAPEGASR
jgi:pilus assembly protein CpaB